MTEATNFRDFNFNQRIRVRLTKHGIRILANHSNEVRFKRQKDGAPDPGPMTIVIRNDWYEIPLVRLIQIFGKSFDDLENPPFLPDAQLEDVDALSFMPFPIKQKN
jgi:hypothetical protein